MQKNEENEEIKTKGLHPEQKKPCEPCLVPKDSWFEELFGCKEDKFHIVRRKFKVDYKTGAIISPNGRKFMSGDFKLKTVSELRDRGIL